MPARLQFLELSSLNISSFLPQPSSPQPIPTPPKSAVPSTASHLHGNGAGAGPGVGWEGPDQTFCFPVLEWGVGGGEQERRGPHLERSYPQEATLRVLTLPTSWSHIDAVHFLALSPATPPNPSSPRWRQQYQTVPTHPPCCASPETHLQVTRSSPRPPRPPQLVTWTVPPTPTHPLHMPQ